MIIRLKALDESKTKLAKVPPATQWNFWKPQLYLKYLQNILLSSLNSLFRNLVTSLVKIGSKQHRWEETKEIRKRAKMKHGRRSSN